MIDELKELTEGTVFKFHDDEMIEFAGSDEIAVSGVRTYCSENGELVIVELEEYFLVAHNFSSEACYFLYQMTESGSLESLENDGCHFLSEDNDFRTRIVIRDDNKPVVYKHSDTGAVYELYEEEEDEEVVSICEYKSAGIYLNHILVEMIETGENTSLNVYQGFAISEDSFSLSED